MRAIVRFVRDLPCHSYFIAMEQVKDGEIGPALQGAMYRELPGMVDLVARYTIQVKADAQGNPTDEEIRALQCRPSAAIPGRTCSVIAKDRVGQFAKWEKPHLGGLIAKAYGSKVL